MPRWIVTFAICLVLLAVASRVVQAGEPREPECPRGWELVIQLACDVWLLFMLFELRRFLR